MMSVKDEGWNRDKKSHQAGGGGGGTDFQGGRGGKNGRLTALFFLF